MNELRNATLTMAAERMPTVRPSRRRRRQRLAIVRGGEGGGRGGGLEFTRGTSLEALRRSCAAEARQRLRRPRRRRSVRLPSRLRARLRSLPPARKPERRRSSLPLTARQDARAST